MSYGLWLSTGGLQTNQYRMSVMANNLANSNTVGFKRDLAIVRERRMESTVAAANRRFVHPTLGAMTGGAFVSPTIHTFEQGDLERTDGPLDLAIYGDGFFAVGDGSDTQYTRDGRMTLNGTGELVMSAGQGRFRVLDTTGQPIRLDQTNSGKIAVREDGTILQGGEPVARIGIVRFEDTTQLTKSGGNLYRNHGAAPSRSTSKIKVGYLEQSTASPIDGMAQMIEISRAYQLNANLISLQDQTTGQAVNTVGRVR